MNHTLYPLFSDLASMASKHIGKSVVLQLYPLSVALGVFTMGMVREPQAITLKRKQCLVICPIGDMGSQIRRSSEGVIKAAIKPVLSRLGFQVVVPHKIPGHGSIMGQITDHLISDELVIANLTGLRPNVMYELGLRRGRKRPVITIAALGTRLPSDVADERTIWFVDDMAGVEELKQQLREAVEAVLTEL